MFVICIKDRLLDRHLCFNLYPCVIKVQSVNQSVSHMDTVSKATMITGALCVRVIGGLRLVLELTTTQRVVFLLLMFEFSNFIYYGGI